MQAPRSLQPCRGLLNAPTGLNAAHRRSTALAATAAPSRAAAAEQTAAKAAKVREQLRQHSSKHARQIHEQNVAIAELQQAAARRAAQQAAQRQQEADQEQQPWPEQQRIQEQQQLRQQQERQQSEQQQQRYQQQKLPLTLRNRQQQFPGGALQQSTDQSALHQQQQQQQHNKQSQPQEGFNRLLQEVEVLARSEDMRDWQTGVCIWRGQAGVAGLRLPFCLQRLLLGFQTSLSDSAATAAGASPPARSCPAMPRCAGAQCVWAAAGCCCVAPHGGPGWAAADPPCTGRTWRSSSNTGTGEGARQVML